jgi:hypothetical protein
MTDSVIAVTGASGLVGRALCAALEAQGATVVRLVRRAATGPGERRWSSEGADISGVDSVVHLAGESIASGIWTPARKRRILESRVEGTRAIARACRDHGVGHLVCAGAVGRYGDRGEEVLTERSAPGRGFLAEVCRVWEEASHAADPVPRACVRFGQILSWEGGALEVQTRLYRLGLGARLGSGRQWMPWISLEDACAAILLCLERRLEGPVNLVSPAPCRQAEFHRLLAARLHRPVFPAVPAFLLKLLPGGFGKELLLPSARVEPEVLARNGFAWRHPDLSAFFG